MFWSLLFLMVLPTIYDVAATVYAGVYHLSLDLLGQIEWFDLISETLRAFLIMPMYHLINRYCKKDGRLQMECNGVLSSLGIISCGIHAAFSFVLCVAVPVLVSAMEIPENGQTIAYLRLETLAFSLSIVYDFCFVVFVNIGKKMYIYLLVSVRLLLYIGANAILIPLLGETGIGVSKAASAVIMSTVSIVILYAKGYLGRPYLRKTVILQWVQEGVFQGGSVLVDNLAYGWMICRIVNSLQGMGNYWAANNFIWGFLLLPCTVMAELIKKECKDTGFKLSKYYKMIMRIVLVWMVTFSGWKWFIGNIMMMEDAERVSHIVAYLVPYYIFYMYSQVFDNYFIGTGNGKYLTINSLIINGIYYVIMFVLYSTGRVIPDMNFVVRMFGFGMVIHCAVSFVQMRISRNGNEGIGNIRQ